MIKEKGVAVHPNEVTPSWEKAILESDINLLGIHPVGGGDSHIRVKELMENGFPQVGKETIERLESNGVGLEYELHAMSMLLPREEFSAHPEWFRLDEEGKRNPDYNCCASDEEALERISRSAEEIARKLPSTTHRYNLWLDDVRDVCCHCEKCKTLSVSDQALKIYNAVLRGLRRVDKDALQSYLAYCGASEVPEKIKPDEGIFLEYAPFDRDFHKPLADEKNKKSATDAEKLIKFFGAKNAKALDYWLDNSLYSGWQKPPKYFELDKETAKSDLEFYEKLGFEVVTTFACYLGSDYEELYGFPNLEGYAVNKRGN